MILGFSLLSVILTYVLVKMYNFFNYIVENLVMVVTICLVEKFSFRPWDAFEAYLFELSRKHMNIITSLI